MQNKNQLIIGALIAMVLVGVCSWRASAYVNENQRIRELNVTLKADNAALVKEVAQLHEQLRTVRPGWRPGVPIGNSPIGNAPGSAPGGFGATPEEGAK